MPQPCWPEASITARKLAGLLLGLHAVVFDLHVLADGFDSLVSGLRHGGGDDFGGARSQLTHRSHHSSPKGRPKCILEAF
ncbi:MAG: hypothetical protein ACJA0V_000745 [Planctomycetota bacterium]|jgi:hypothetical protein